MTELKCERAIEATETDNELCAQLALKMAALLPSDPEQGEQVLDLLARVYRCINDHRPRPRSRPFRPGAFEG